MAGMVFFTDNYQDPPQAAAESAKKFCGNCGTELNGAKFCGECGTPAG